MKITKNNLKEIQQKFHLEDNNISLLNALLDDIDIFNKLPIRLFPICIGIQEWHDDYDEYPDHYGEYTIYIDCEKETGRLEPISSNLLLYGLDESLCVLCSYLEDTIDILENIKEKDESKKV